MSVTKSFTTGPWRGMIYTSEPFASNPELGRTGVNGYFPDPRIGSGFYSRPGVFLNGNTKMATTASNPGQGVVSVAVADGTTYNFLFADGKMWRWATDLTSAPVNVTPANISIATTKFVFAESLGDSVIVNDGVNPPWIATNLSGTPVTGTLIDYETPTVHLSIGSTPTSVATDAFSYIIGGTRYTKTAVVAGTALPAGTIPTNTWGVYRVTVNTGGTITVTAGAANYTTGYATEALAIAAVPSVANTLWNVGYFTVLTAVGNPFIANTSALEGGIGGNPSSDTNYYVGSSKPWRAFGQPVIYTGAMFFILKDVDGVAARSAITWSEPNLPNVGYRQTDYDNLWELTQTSSEPLFTLAATNDVLYYSRAYSWGAIAGAPGVNFSTTATHDVVSGNIGCVSPATVAVFLNYVYFCDQWGRPCRFAVGSTPEPIWKQCREYFEDAATNTAALVAAGNAWAAIEPNLNVYVVGSLGDSSSAATSAPLIFDAMTGIFSGVWIFESADNANAAFVDAAGLVYNASGQKSLAFLERPSVGVPNSVTIHRLTLPSEGIWSDTMANIFITFSFTAPWMGYSGDKSYNATGVTVLLERGDGAAVGAMNGTLDTTNGRTTLNAITPPSVVANGGGVGRYMFQPYTQVSGRGFRATFEAQLTSVQLKLYQITVNAVETNARIDDR